MATEPAPVESIGNDRKPDVLLVEDDPFSREQLADLLRPHARCLHLAGNGEEGLKVYAEKRPDVVITDILMPGMDGIEMTRRIRSIDHAARIIVTTAYGEVEPPVSPDQLPVQIVQKPVDIDELLLLLNSPEKKARSASRGC